jgi:hypothetical protein
MKLNARQIEMLRIILNSHYDMNLNCGNGAPFRQKEIFYQMADDAKAILKEVKKLKPLEE